MSERGEDSTAVNTPSGASVAADPSREATVAAGGAVRSRDATNPGIVGPALAEVGRDHYEILAEFGRGGLGRVLRARDLRTGRIVAIKEALSSAPSLLARFAREAVVTANLQHPSIVPVYEVGRWTEGGPFYAMKLVAGRTLSDASRATTTLRDRIALLPHVIAVADAIAYAHGEHIVHRDLKPANILIGDFGETVVIDWGLAKRLDDLDEPAQGGPHDATGSATIVDALVDPVAAGDSAPSELRTVAGAVLGTPGYMAPEQARGDDIDERIDVYAIGAMLYELLSTVRPYGELSRAADVMIAATERAPRPLAEIDPVIPADLVAIVERAMAIDPANRYRTARALADDLKRFQTGQLVGAHDYSAWMLARRWVRQHRAVVIAAAIAFAIVVGLGAFSVARIRAARDRAVAAQAGAETASRLAEDRLRALFQEDGRQALLAGAPDRALAYLAAAPHGPIRDFLIGRAVEHLDPLDAVLVGHTAPSAFVEWSPDGTRVVSTADDDTIRVWDATTHRALRVFPGGPIITWSPDALHLIGTDHEGEVVVWDAASGARVATAKLPKVGPANVEPKGDVANDVPRAIANTLDGTLFAAGGTLGGLAWWHGAAATPVAAMHAHDGAVNAVAFSDDGSLVVSAGDDKLARVWRADGSAVATLRGHTDGIVDVRVSPDGTRVVTASRDGTAAVWDAMTGALRLRLTGHKGWVDSARFDPSGTRVLTGSEDSTAVVWDAVTGEHLATLAIGSMTHEAAWSHDGAWIVTRSEDGAIGLFDGASYQRVATLIGHASSVGGSVFSPDDTRLVSASLDHDVRLWRVERSRAVLTLATGGVRAWRGALSPDGTHVATTGADGQARVFSALPDPANAGQPLRTLRHGPEVMAVAYAPDGKRLATASADGTAKVWDLAAGASVLTLVGRTANVRAIAFSPDGHHLATSEADGAARVWDASTGAPIAAVRDDAGAVRAVVWSPDSRRFVTLLVGPAAAVWDASGKLVARIPTSDQIYSAAWSADGTRVAIGTGAANVGIYDASTGARVHDLIGHAVGPVTAVSFSPDGRTLLTSGFDGTARTWDLATGEARFTVGAAHDTMISAAFRPDGLVFATASGHTVQIWDAATGIELARLPGDDDVATLTWSSDGARLLVPSLAQAPRVWQLPAWTGSDAELAAVMKCAVPWRLDGAAVIAATPDPSACAGRARGAP